jgi:hypothetical protein
MWYNVIMANMQNPFKPSLGKTPPVFIGREDFISDIEYGLENGSGDPNLITFFMGARGIGKTALLNEISKRAEKQKWATINVTATDSLLTSVLDELQKYTTDDFSVQVSGINAMSFGINFATKGRIEHGWRYYFDKMTEKIYNNKKYSGIFITVDEVHKKVSDFEEFAATIQHHIREDKNVAVIMAGLPNAVNKMLEVSNNTGTSTFISKAEQHLLNDVNLKLVEKAFVKIAADSDKIFADGVALKTAKATFGYPLLIQNVGYELWRVVGSGGNITDSHIEEAVPNAKRKFGSRIHSAALRGLSDVDKSFLMAMSMDDTPSKVSDIVKRLRTSPQYVGIYRARLIENGFIIKAGHGMLDFAIPYLRDYLREHFLYDIFGE